jgi:hypothetical protein
VPDFVAWLLSVDWWSIVRDAAIPVAAILVPTFIAVRLARNERLAADRGRYLEARRLAAQSVIIALARMVSVDPTAEPLQEKIRDLRGHIAVYRTVLSERDLLSGDWLGLKHQQGMSLWSTAMDELEQRNGSLTFGIEEKLEILRPAQAWAHATMETFSGWLGNHVPDETLQREGALLLSRNGGDETA